MTCILRLLNKLNTVQSHHTSSRVLSYSDHNCIWRLNIYAVSFHLSLMSHWVTGANFHRILSKELYSGLVSEK